MKKIMKFLAAAIVFIISFSQAAFAGSDTSITDDGFIPATVEQFVYLFNMEFGSKPELLISNLSKYDGNASNDEEHDIYVGTLGKSTSILIWADKNTDRVYGVGLFQNTAKAAADVYIQREIYSGAVTLSGLFCGIDKNNVKDLEVIFPGLDLNARIKPYSTWNKFGNIVIGLDINESEMSFITFVDLDNKKIKIAVNDEFIDLTTAPEIIDNRVFVPVRGLFENLNKKQ